MQLLINKNLFILHFALFLGSFSLFSQNYDFNNYKYRFQKLRIFEIGTNSFNTDIRNKNITIENKADTGILEKNTENKTDFGISLGLNAYYFQNINTDNLQQNINAYVGYSSTIQPEFIKNKNNNNAGSKTFNNNNNLNTNINFSILNRYYKPSNNFTYLNLSTRNHLFAYRNNYNSESSVNSNVFSKNESQTNRTSLNSFSSIEYGFGKGRLEYVSDPIMATFLIKDLIEKADIKNVSNEQIENIAKGITKIRNTRFLDFRFRLIDQIEMLDEVLKQNGIETNKTAKYYTTIYDNWLYATQKQRFSGNRWTYYLKNETNFRRENEKSNQYNILADTNIYYSKSSNNSFFINNGFSVDYETSKQKSLTVQKAKGFNVFIFHQMYDSLRTFENRFGKNTVNTYGDTFNSQSLNIRIQGKWAYLYQPNTRTFFEFSLNPGVSSQMFLKDVQNSIDQTFNKLNNNVFLGVNLEYFRFINARLNFTVWARTFTNFNLSNNEYIYDNSNKNMAISKQTNLNGNYNIGASINYLIF
ncbi:MAG: hypothetical protein Q8K70_05170 [Bacteroidota bacterium]|nr:hypothetical protein [Bacteroidota bacterium]